MRELNLLQNYPQSEKLLVDRTIGDRILASYRGRAFFDGTRSSGYGGMEYDGRWKPVAEDFVKEYQPKSVIQLQCEKGFLLKEFFDLGLSVQGTESSSYARRNSHSDVAPFIYSFLPKEGGFDLVIALGLVYTLSFPEAMHCIRKIQDFGHSAFITLAAYDTEEELRLFKKWTLLGTTILRKNEWLEVLKHCGYTGDYSFVTAKTLKLREA